MWALLCERLVISNYSFDFKIISCTIVQHSTYVRYRPRWKTKLKHIEIKLTKRCQVTRHVFTSLLINIQEFAWIEVFHEIVDFFVLNVWFNWFSLHALSQKEETHSEPAVHKTNYNLISNITLSVSTYKYKLKQVPSQVSVNLLWRSIIVLLKY